MRWLLALLLTLTSTLAIESAREAASLAKTLLAHHALGLGTISAVYPDDYADDDFLRGRPVSAVEYFAPTRCEGRRRRRRPDHGRHLHPSHSPANENVPISTSPDWNGDLAFIVLPIESVWHQVLNRTTQRYGQVTLTTRWSPVPRWHGPPFGTGHEARRRHENELGWDIHDGAVAWPRLTLWGEIELLPAEEDKTPATLELADCFHALHPDTLYWGPPSGRPHVAYWAVFRPRRVHLVGGFGNEHYIGPLDMDLYRAASADWRPGGGKGSAWLVQA